jgi:LuxR family maltose regulon positive regulatory protein
VWAGKESVARAARDWLGFGKPAVLVLDDAHLLGEQAAAVASRLITGASPGSLVVLAGRALPKLADPSLPLLRATGRLHELGTADLALSRREAAATLKALGVSVPDGELTTLLEKTEGWPAGICRAAELLPGSRGRRNGFRNCHDELLEFVREECLAALDHDLRVFLRRTSILDRMCGALCDTTLGMAGSSQLLESLAAEAMFVVPLDRRDDWYRYHQLLRDTLRQELLAHEPELVAELHRRAAGWLERQGDYAGALRHAHAGGRTADFMRIFGTAALSEYMRGRSGAVQEWLGDLGTTEELAADRQAAVVAARLHAHEGRLGEAEGCLRAASRGRGHDARTSARNRLVRAALCTRGPEAMLADAEGALGKLTGNDPWRPYGLLLEGAARILLGDEAGAATSLAQATTAAERLEAHDSRMLALAEASLLAADRGSWPEADAHLLRACSTARDHRLEDYPVFALPLALSARTHLRNGLWADAQSAIGATQRLLPRLTCALPWLAVQARLELAAGFVMLRDAPSASALLVEADEILALRPLGRLNWRRDRLAAEVAAIPAGDEGRTIRLSRAELRLLPLLGTHLSFREIGAHLFLSRHTVKTQAISAYRKLGASSRREAVVEAARLALIDAPTDLAA